MTRYLFLSGVGRSGTTALRNSLGLHPEIYYNGKENNAVQDLLSVAQKNIEMSSRKYALVVEPDVYFRSFEELMLKIIWPDAEQRRRLTLLAAVNFEPSLLPTARQIFPDCKLVCLIRSGIGVISSRMKYQSFADDEFAQHCQVWLRSVQMARWADSNPAWGRVVRQEWFSEEERIRGEFKALFQWAGLSPDDEPTQNIVGKRYHPTVAAGQSTDDLAKHYGEMDIERRKAVESNRLDRWKDWTAPQRDHFVETCGDAMTSLGYSIPWL